MNCSSLYHLRKYVSERYPNYLKIINDSVYVGKVFRKHGDYNYYFKFSLKLSQSYTIYFIIHEYNEKIKILGLSFDSLGSFIRFPEDMEIILYFKERKLEYMSMNVNINEEAYLESLKQNTECGIESR